VVRVYSLGGDRHRLLEDSIPHRPVGPVGPAWVACYAPREVSGTLFVIATPLGNLDDLSERALATLRRVDFIACEDTRRTVRLLARHAIRTPLLSCHRFNEISRASGILDRLRSGKDCALVSDGGTPGVSDPGAVLVAAAADEGLQVVPIPGPSAVTTLLSVSGLPADRYVFDGFLPHRGGQRRRRLRELREETRTVVLFESPHRVLETLREIGEIYGERRLVVGREMTKSHETTLRGSAAELIERLAEPVRGEITIAIAGRSPREAADVAPEPEALLVRRWREALSASSGDRRAALKTASRALGMKRAELYRRLVEIGEDPDGEALR
jgi:16S rRNA (cytidine1402-2'-O)-methyltransferase